MRTFNFCGTPPVDTVTSIPATLTVGAPVSAAPAQPGFPAAVGVDGNPIRLILGQPTVAANMAHGSVFLLSAARFGSTSPPLILRYWDLALNGTALTGTLTQDHREEAAAGNLLAADTELIPCRPNLGAFGSQFAIAEGTTLEGTITQGGANLLIQGATVDQTRAFAAQFVGAAR
jgi:hypothetical protein